MPVLVVSYTRVHRPLVRPLVAMLRAAIPDIDDAVFWDEDFEPGRDWFAQFTKSVDEARKLFVFWCSHAAASAQVAREYGYALDHHKMVIPVLLDDTPLPETLSPIHGIEMRGAIEHGGSRAPGAKLRGLAPDDLTIDNLRGPDDAFGGYAVERPIDLRQAQLQAIVRQFANRLAL